jgi:hypothetical protein
LPVNGNSTFKIAGLMIIYLIGGFADTHKAGRIPFFVPSSFGGLTFAKFQINEGLTIKISCLIICCQTNNIQRSQHLVLPERSPDRHDPE